MPAVVHAGRMNLRHVALLPLVVLALASPAAITAQVQELPNVPLVTSGWQEKFWTHADGTKFHYLEWGAGTPGGHLSSYMAGLCPEVYRDALTDFVVRNNPKTR